MAQHRHKRETNARRLPKAHLVAAPLAFLATATTVGFGVVATSAAESSSSDVVTAASTDIDLGDRTAPLSRSQSRTEGIVIQKADNPLVDPVATQRAIRNADTKLWVTADLNLWTAPGDDAENIGLVETGERVLVTGRKTADRTEIVWNGKARWVTIGYLVEEKPVKEKPEDEEEPAEGDVAASCTNGTTVPSGVSPNIAAVHEAVCANFPEITTYGTFRGDGEHAQGIAVDIMVSGERGWQVAEFVRANYAELGVSYIIYSQSIWSVERSGEGWRGMEDRGSTTANHYDHVHVTTY